MGELKGGCYSILVRVWRETVLDVGRLGRVVFPAGHYVYTGRDGSGSGLRIARHMKKEKRCRWHIDYLTSSDDVTFLEGIVHGSRGDRECDVNRRICGLPGAQVLTPGFGSSDCRRGCRSHLVYFEKKPCLVGYAI